MSAVHAEPADFGVVVLNYNDHESTVTCVHSWIACDPAPRKIVVVDNDSPNQSLSILQGALGSLPKVEVVGSGHNGGYSFGNNVGIRQLRAEGCKHVVIATSDTIVQSSDLLSHLAAATSSKIGVVSPQIISGGAFDNPSVERLTFRYLVDLLWVRWGMPLLTLRRRLAYLVRKVVPRQRQLAQSKQHKAVSVGPPRVVYKLHGAFLCLTDSFLTQVGELDDSIFMFGEEDLLAWHCLHHGLAQVLVPSATVLHAHDSSIKLTWGKKSNEFVDRQQKNSCNVLRQKIPMRPLVKAWIKGYPPESEDSNKKAV